MKKYLIVVVGPTAVGKTALSILLAKHFKTAIISADSRQFYKEMTIGTAKPDEHELASVKHYLVNSLSIHDEYNSGKFEQDALSALEEIFVEHDVAILCGGSGLYVEMVCKGSDPMPERNAVVRGEMQTLYEKSGIEALRKKLAELDPEFYETVDKENPHRLIRALEVCITSGQKYSELRKGIKAKRPFSIIKVGLEEERTKVYERINQRVDEMIAKGLVEEARALYPFRELNALLAPGYTELFNHFKGDTSLVEAIDLIKQHTRNYAKRQWTWFRKDTAIEWFAPHQSDQILEYIRGAMTSSV